MLLLTYRAQADTALAFGNVADECKGESVCGADRFGDLN